MTPQQSAPANRDIIVIGASAGGIEALQRLVVGLPADLPAAVFIVQHLSPHSLGYLPSILGRASPLPVDQAQDGAPIRPGRIVVAPPDVHLTVTAGGVRVRSGPKEHGLRPAIDPLFRSAAWAFGPRVVGVILTGLLDDGTAGLIAVKLAGGLAIVQEPGEAAFPSMPRAVLRYLQVDERLPLAEIAPALERLTQQPAAVEDRTMPSDPEDRTEAIIRHQASAVERGEGTDRPALVSCPDCGGTLWRSEQDGLTQFQCRVGHRYTAESVMRRQAENLEQTLWAAVRTLEEQAMLARTFATHAQEHDDPGAVERWTAY
jgi:two-component system, chemotaxis family, protein-glutamate methylesterase/glutaminase